MKASVIVCTKNRASLLVKCVRSILDAEQPPGEEIEVVVIDNGSTDDTPRAMEELVSVEPRLRCIREERPGKSNALNRGIEESCGDLLIFTDDDLTVDRNWLTGLLHAADTIPADAYGGKVVAQWDGPVPDWVPRLPDGRPFGGAVVEHDKGDKPVPYGLDTPGWPLGANVLFRRRVFERLGVYRVDLGLADDAPVGGEDTEMVRRTLEAGMKIVYVPDAVVYHPVFRDRLTRSFFRGWVYRHSRESIMGSDAWMEGPLVFGLPKRDVTGIWRAVLRLAYRTVAGSPSERFAEQCCVIGHWVHLTAAWQRSRSAKSRPGRVQSGFGGDGTP